MTPSTSASGSTARPEPAGRSGRFSRRTLTGAGLAAGGAVALGVDRSLVPDTLARQATPVAPPPATPVIPATAATFDPALELAVRVAAEAARATTFTPGTMIHVVDPARGELSIALGVADLATGRPATLDDPFRIASVTKTFTATVILQLVDEGVLSLDDPLEGFIPGIANGEVITLRQVLNMSAGIFDWVDDPVFDADYEADPLLVSTPQDAVGIVRQHPADFAPGAAVRYSNTNYILLGLIIEQLTGQTAAGAITERIIRPLGLDATIFALDETMPDNAMRGYAAAAPGAILTDVTLTNPDIPWTAGAIRSTVADMGVWARALGTGTLLTPDLQRQRLETAVLASGLVELRYGLGILTVNGMIGHSGGIFGFNSWVLYDPDRDATLVIVTNRSNNEGGSADAVLVAIAPLLFPERFPGLAPAAGKIAPRS